jgi:hypothetical protein
MGINDIAVERIFKFLVEEKAIAKLLKVIENGKTGGGESVPRSSKKKILLWSQTDIGHRMPWLN